MTWKEKPNSHLAAEGESHGLNFPLQSYPDDFNLPSCLSALERKKSQHMALSVWISVNSWLIGRDSDAGKDWGQEKKRAIEYEKDEWHYGLNGHEFEETLGDGDGQGSLVVHGVTELDTTEQLNWLVI